MADTTTDPSLDLDVTRRAGAPTTDTIPDPVLAPASTAEEANP